MLAAGVTDVSDGSSINEVLTKITENDWEQQAVTGVAGSCFIPAARGPPMAQIGCPSGAETLLRIIRESHSLKAVL